jgi:hypothetical protein
MARIFSFSIGGDLFVVRIYKASGKRGPQRLIKPEQIVEEG